MTFPPVRLTVRNVMIGVAILAVALGGALQGSGALARRATYQGWARHYRWKEAGLREQTAGFANCRAGHQDLDRDSDDCPACLQAWQGVLLKDDIRTPAQAVEALNRTADVLGRWAARFERGAAWPLVDLPRPSAAEIGALRFVEEGYGPVMVGYFDAY